MARVEDLCSFLARVNLHLFSTRKNKVAKVKDRLKVKSLRGFLARVKNLSVAFVAKFKDLCDFLARVEILWFLPIEKICVAKSLLVHTKKHNNLCLYLELAIPWGETSISLAAIPG